jgi:hypothetical protein
LTERTILELDEEIRNSDAARAVNRITYLIDLLNMFSRNCEQLHDLVAAVNQTFELYDVDYRGKPEIIYLEINRLLHNFLASASSIIAITEANIQNEYKNTTISDELDSIFTNFYDNILARFILNLRNFSLHYQLVRPYWQLNMQRISPTEFKQISSVVISKQYLLGYKKWNIKSKQYMETQPDDIPLLPMIEEYYKIIYQLQISVNDALKRFHSGEIAWFEQKQSDFRRLYEQQILGRPIEQG